MGVNSSIEGSNPSFSAAASAWRGLRPRKAASRRDFADVAVWFRSELGEPVEAVAEAETIAAFNGLLGAALHLNRIRASGERDVFASFVKREMSELVDR